MARKRTAPELQLVRATVNLSGIRAGRLAWVNPGDPAIAELLQNKFLVEEKPTANDKPPEE